MTFLGLFKNKKKQVEDAASASRNEIIQKLTMMRGDCRNVETAALINEIKNLIESQPSSTKEEIVRADIKILDLLSDAYKDIAAGLYPAANSTLGIAKTKVIERKELCQVGGTLTKDDAKKNKALEDLRKKFPVEEKDNIEKIMDDIRKKNRNLAAKKAQFNSLAIQAQNSPGDFALEAQGRAVQAEIVSLQNELQSLMEYLVTFSNHHAMESIVGTSETWESLARDVDIDTDMLENRLDQVSANLAARKEKNSRISEKLNAGVQSSGSVFSNAATQSSGSVFGNAAAQNSGSVFGNATAQNSGSVFGNAAPAQQAQHNGFDASKMGTTEMKRNLSKTITLLEDQHKEIQRDMERANDQIADLNAELRQLLAERKTLPASECISHDAKIDAIDAKRNTLKHKVERLANQSAQISGKLNLLQKLDTEQDIAAAGNRISELSGGMFADLQGLSVFLAETIAQGNVQLGEINDAGLVAGSEGVNTTSGAAMHTRFTDGTAVKDENKYDYLESDVGAAMTY